MKKRQSKRIVIEKIFLVLSVILFITYYWEYVAYILRILWQWAYKYHKEIEFIKNIIETAPIVFLIVFFICLVLIYMIWGKGIKKAIKDFNKIRHKSEKSPPPLPSKSPAIFPVDDMEDLEKIAISGYPFMENTVRGKPFGKSVETKSWSDIKKEIDFSKLQPIDLSLPHRVFVITGKHGDGKSTYMLWNIDKHLIEKKRTFNKVVFLNHKIDTCSQWADELIDCIPEKTLLVIDSLWRESDHEDDFKIRCKHLFTLAFEGVQIGEKTVGPFKVLTTIRKDEYDDLLKMRDFAWLAHSPPFEYQILPENLDFEKILKNYLASYNVQNDIPTDKEKEAIEILVCKSEGSPFYIRHLFESLKENKQNFSEQTLALCPVGVVNLIWETITKRYYVEHDTVIPFLLLLLSRSDISFSSHFFDFVIKKFVAENKTMISNKVEGLKKRYFQYSFGASDIKPTEDVSCFALDSHWKMSIRRGLEKPNDIYSGYQGAVTFYKHISDAQFGHLKEEIAKEIENHVKEGFKDKADAFLCVDLAKLSEKYLNTATELYTQFINTNTSKLQQDYIKYVQEELYELWITNAWKYRKTHNVDEVITCYENAFNKLGVKSHRKQISAYAYFITRNVLPVFTYGSREFKEWTERAESLYKEVISLEPSDKISWQTFALFYQDLDKYQESEECFEKALQIDPNHIPTLQAYAIFLKEMGKTEWVRDTTKALDFYRRAEERFIKAKEILENKKQNLPQEEIKEVEKRLLNAYALFLIDKTEWCRELDERIKIDGEIDKLLEGLLNKYPDHGPSINVYVRFLMGYARILPKYKGKGGKNLEKAEKLLTEFIEKKNKEDISYFMSLHILATYSYRQKPSFYKQLINFEQVEKLLKESSQSFNSRHNSIVYNELGQVYSRWANIFRKNNKQEYNGKMELADLAYQKAMELPENQHTAIHLSKVYFNYAFYLRYKDDRNKQLEWIDKAIKIAQKFAYNPFNHYYSLTNLGDEMLREGNIKQAMLVFTNAQEIGTRLSIVVWYAIFKLGEIYKQEGDVEKALEHYLESAKLENSSQGYGTRRDSIKHLMKDYDDYIKRRYLYNECIKARIECSKSAYELNPGDYKNCGDYGEDLLKMKKYEEAIPILKQGAALIPQAVRLSDIEKRGKISWLYQEIGFCYQHIGEHQEEAEEYFDKSAEIEDTAIGYFKHADRMFRFGKYKKTLASFKKFIDKFPSCEEDKKEDIFLNLATTLNNIGECYEKLNRKDEAILAWKDYANVSSYHKPENGSYVFGLIGNKLNKKEKSLEARECFIKSIRTNQRNAKNWSQLGEINKRLEKWHEAMICYELAHTLNNDMRDKDGYQSCKTKDEQSPKVYNNSNIEDLVDQAVIEELQNKSDDALGYYNKALTLLDEQEDKATASNSKCYRFIADAFCNLGKRNDALKLYEDKVKNIVEGLEKIVVEAIIWFTYK
ncbi:MAG: tetratricopeptide repeat protein [Nitrospinae bacterium]|nr:tetratricopeptide repeat protein [Nitrospinota bacterium]